MEEKEDAFTAVCRFLKDMADKANAGKAYVDFTTENGDVFRIEYKPAKKGAKNGSI